MSSQMDLLFRGLLVYDDEALLTDMNYTNFGPNVHTTWGSSGLFYMYPARSDLDFLSPIAGCSYSTTEFDARCLDTYTNTQQHSAEGIYVDLRPLRNSSSTTDRLSNACVTLIDSASLMKGVSCIEFSLNSKRKGFTHSK